ncbi:sorting nexin-13-like isoform X2 [Toxorhynchites rutilus septentrionalis]|uniref:sorting nexin-13-like isoform X2 n=1 Tax=Toxorhynchites rutilus septentrionalis TaxID=329112 RepID=UPI0024788E7C|nr:sorting nexin-13-like isoform X2 [Toxorhynchites rutilus septentrionalis]
MEFKYASWIVLSVGVSINIFGLFWFVAILIGLVGFVVGFLTILYLQHGDLDKFLDSGLLENPLDEPRILGLSIVQTESRRSKLHASASLDQNKRRNLLDAGIELLFKKRTNESSGSGGRAGSGTTGAGGGTLLGKSSTGSITDHLMHKGHLHFHQKDNTILDNTLGPPKAASGTGQQGKQPSPMSEERPGMSRWRPFENIKIHTDKGRSTAHHSSEWTADKPHNKKESGAFQIGEEVTASTMASSPLATFKSYITHPEVLLHRDSPPGSPKKKKILSGHKGVDKLIHSIVDYVIRDFIESWYAVVSDSREFSDTNIRGSIETLVLKVCQRIKSAELLPLMTTKVIDDLARHTRFYRLATQDVSNNTKAPSGADLKRLKIHEKLSPQKKNQRGNGHRRNKSETDLTWHLGNAALQKNVANSKFYGGKADEQSLIDPEIMLLNSFFGFSDVYKQECMDEEAMLAYFKRIAETVLYFTLPEEDFNCLTLRSLLCNILTNNIIKPMVNMLTDPDFINLQIAKHFTKEPPSGEFLLKMIRQSNDLSELRACRQLITKEMDAKHKDSNCSSELASLKYAQKLIDLRISHLQSNKNDPGRSEKDKTTSNLPLLSLDDILRKELAVSYYLDYLSVLNLQKYVIFYLTAQEWKITTSQSYSEMQVNKSRIEREELMRIIRDKANHLYQEYLVPKSTNCLSIDPGLIEALAIRVRDTSIQPENTWFDSICKYVYEKQKNEEVFLNNFYQSSAYKQLLRELDFSNTQESELPSLEHLGISSQVDSLSDTNSGDVRFDETDDDDMGTAPSSDLFHSNIKEEYDVRTVGTAQASTKRMAIADVNLLPAVANVKHARSHSDCTGMFTTINDINAEQLKSSDCSSSNDSGNELAMPCSIVSPATLSTNETSTQQPPVEIHIENRAEETLALKQKLSAKIINTAIHCEGHYAVYAIQVGIIEDNEHKSWHIYRRYSKFLELKKLLVKRFPALSKVPFPAKKTFQNTQRAVLEHRMEILNLFLQEICVKAEQNDEMRAIVRNFLEPDTDDRKMHGGAVVKTIESFKSGMSKIRNMPDTLVGGISRMFLGKGPLKERTFYDIQDIPTLELKQSEYPALASALNLLDEVFDLQNKSQWLRRGLINRLLGAPWVSHATNKKIVQLASSLLSADKVETVLSAVLNNVWPEGDRFNPNPPLREDSTKLRTKLAAKIALFALLSDDLKHVVGSVTCNTGLLNFFQMLQNKKLNTRLLLILIDHLLRVMFQTDSMTKHVMVASGEDGSTIRIGTPSGSAAGSRKSSKHY